MKHILVTGGAGFIGSHFIRLVWEHGKEDDLCIVNFDALTYAGSREAAETLCRLAPGRIVFRHGNVCDRIALDALLEEFEIDTIVHFAAETHVDRSIADPTPFMTTNVLGTLHLLEAALQRHRLGKSVRFLHISTDEVYGPAREGEPPCDENAAFRPSSPYAASKAAADHLASAYHRTYGLPVLIARPSNNYGPGQHREKLIPLAITEALVGRSIPIYGDGLQCRDWLFVRDHVDALLRILRFGREGEAYNIGGLSASGVAPITNTALVSQIVSLCGADGSGMHAVTDRLGHDRQYAIDSSKIRTRLGWRPATALQDGLRETVAWYRALGAESWEGYESRTPLSL